MGDRPADVPTPASPTTIDDIMKKVEEKNSSVALEECEFTMGEPDDPVKLTITWKSPTGEDKNFVVNLGRYIGNVGGQLVWGGKGFNESCENPHLEEKTVLVAQCRCTFRDSGGKEIHIYDGEGKVLYVERRLDLKNHIIYDKAHAGGSFNLVGADDEFSHVISSAKWMKYAIITQPDMGSFLREKAVKDAVSMVAARTVAQVMHQTEQVLAEVVKVALDMIKQKVQDHIDHELDRLVKTAALSTAYSSGLGGFTQMEDAHRMAYHSIAPHMEAFKSILPPDGKEQSREAKPATS
ncbi:hypothetical protein K438DRAFT_1780786 [Mycena galopus ATCC 62051]|nr:hypothetical protein K438DRAFT_1780786 [Mycena galopus ATCC 62051]